MIELDLNDEQMIGLLNILKYIPTLNQLDISSNSFTSNSMTVFKEEIYHLVDLESIDISSIIFNVNVFYIDNCLNEDGCDKLLDGLFYLRNIKNIYMNGIGFTDFNKSKLSNLLRKSIIKRVYLENNPIKEKETHFCDKNCNEIQLYY